MLIVAISVIAGSAASLHTTQVSLGAATSFAVLAAAAVTANAATLIS